jgi:hypothetical protein
VRNIKSIITRNTDHEQRQFAVVTAAAMVLSLVSGCAGGDEGYAYGHFMSRHPNIEAADINTQRALERMHAATRANG